MVLSRATALRASSIARFVQPARAIRTAEQQPWQRMLRQGARRTYASAHGGHGATKTSDLPWMVGAVATTVVGGYVVLTQDLSHGVEHDDEHHDEKHDEKHEDGEEEAPAEDDSKDEVMATKEKLNKERREDDSPAVTDPATTQKPAKGPNEMSGKQEGLSNADSGHSTPVADNPNKSSKGEGTAETAKLKGTVDPNRPQV